MYFFWGSRRGKRKFCCFAYSFKFRYFLEKRKDGHLKNQKSLTGVTRSNATKKQELEASKKEAVEAAAEEKRRQVKESMEATAKLNYLSLRMTQKICGC